MEGFPSGQREQTVNLSSMTSVVRIHHLPPKLTASVRMLFFCFEGGGFESRLLETARWAVSIGVALPQQRESTPSEGERPFCALRGHNPSIPGNGDTLTSCAKAARSRSPSEGEKGRALSERDYIRLFATTRRPGAYLSHFPLTRRVKKQTARHIQSPTIAIQIPIAPIPKCTAST